MVSWIFCQYKAIGHVALSRIAHAVVFNQVVQILESVQNSVSANQPHRLTHRGSSKHAGGVNRPAYVIEVFEVG